VTQAPAPAPLLERTFGSRAALAARQQPSGLLVNALAIVAFAAIVIVGSITTEGFATWDNVKAILSAVAFVGIIAIGMTVIMLSGNLFSLSLGVTAAVTAIFFMYALGWGLAAAIVLTLGLGLLIVGLQGVMVGAWGANPIIVTIGAGGLQTGVALWLTGGESILPHGSSDAYQALARPLGGIPVGIYFFFGVALAVELMLRRTRFGREIYLLGENRGAARAAALSVTRITTAAFALAGLCTGLAGVLIGAASANGSLLLEGQYTYDAIAAAIVGGNAVSGGRGSVSRTVVGAILIATISDLLLLRGYSTGVQLLVKGLIVFVVVILMNLERGRAR
jgi:ribose/xylose/arabinose/galactoside ABC-type transport system permease subunit